MEEGSGCLARTQGHGIRQKEQQAPRVERAQVSRKPKEAAAAIRRKGREVAGSSEKGRAWVRRTLGFVQFFNDTRKPLRVVS